MSVSAIPATTTTATKAALVKLGNGEYTAASVSSDPTDAAKLGLQKEKDGNYGTTTPDSTSVSSATPAASSTASSTLAAVINLTLGGL